ncbi:hypothetical protein DL765_009746 [Monosporascus sp. GIB2]|nr:hypothetical protein DL765_009746 [Monosporascus sp. GIB2]
MGEVNRLGVYVSRLSTIKISPTDVSPTCWGNVTETVPIETSGFEFQVTHNLHVALCRVARIEIPDPYLLWVDAVCINKNDAEERGYSYGSWAIYTAEPSCHPRPVAFMNTLHDFLRSDEERAKLKWLLPRMSSSCADGGEVPWPSIALSAAVFILKAKLGVPISLWRQLDRIVRVMVDGGSNDDSLAKQTDIEGYVDMNESTGGRRDLTKSVFVTEKGFVGLGPPNLKVGDRRIRGQGFYGVIF